MDARGYSAIDQWSGTLTSSVRRPRLPAARRRRTTAPAPRARFGPVHALRLRRAVDGEDRQGGGDQQGAALPLLPEQGGVLRRHARGEGERAAAADDPEPGPAAVRATRGEPRRVPEVDRGEQVLLRQD